MFGSFVKGIFQVGQIHIKFIKIKWQKIAEEKDEALSELSAAETSDKQLPAN